MCFTVDPEACQYLEYGSEQDDHTRSLVFGLQEKLVDNVSQATGARAHFTGLPCDFPQRTTGEAQLNVTQVKFVLLLREQTVLWLREHSNQSLLIEGRYSAHGGNATDQLRYHAILLKIGGLYMI